MNRKKEDSINGVKYVSQNKKGAYQKGLRLNRWIDSIKYRYKEKEDV